MISKRQFCTAVTAAPFISAFGQAGFPDKPIKMVVGFAPGGGADLVARLMGPYLTKELGQAIVVENKPGVGGNIAAKQVAESKPDGYTIMMGTIAALGINPHIYKDKLGFDPDRDFAPITNVVNSCNILVVPLSSPISNVRQLLEAGKKKEMTYGSSGVGTAGHLAGVLYTSLTGNKLLHVPYKSGGALMNGILAGEVDMSFASGVTAVPQIEGKKLKALGVTTVKRASALPNLLTLNESGIAGFASNNWHGIVAPAATPKAIVDRLNAACVKVLKNPEVMEKLRLQALDAAPTTPDEFGTFMRFERAKWGRLIRDAKLKIEI